MFRYFVASLTPTNYVDPNRAAAAVSSIDSSLTEFAAALEIASRGGAPFLPPPNSEQNHSSKKFRDVGHFYHTEMWALEFLSLPCASSAFVCWFVTLFTPG